MEFSLHQKKSEIGNKKPVKTGRGRTGKKSANRTTRPGSPSPRQNNPMIFLPFIMNSAKIKQVGKLKFCWG